MDKRKMFKIWAKCEGYVVTEDPHMVGKFLMMETQCAWEGFCAGLNVGEKNKDG